MMRSDLGGYVVLALAFVWLVFSAFLGALLGSLIDLWLRRIGLYPGAAVIWLGQGAGFGGALLLGVGLGSRWYLGRWFWVPTED